MEKYSSYKDSGVKWLGEIPSHWEVVPLKYCISINNGRDYKEYESSEGIPVIGTGGQFAYSSVEMYRGEVVFFGRKGTVDKPFYYNGSFWAVDTVFFAIPKNNMLCKYLYYVGTTIPFGLYSTSTAIPSMTQTDLMNNPFALPPLSEQQTIVSYLDSVTSQIDVAIEQQKKMIELLNERKQIIINNAVTKGLDPNVKMKDSGVDWIWEIPEGWEVRRLASLGNFSKGGNISRDDLQEFGKCAILYGDIYTKYNYQTSDVKNHISESVAKKSVRIFKDDILMTGSGETKEDIGKSIAYNGEEAYIGGDVILFRQKGNNSIFLSYALNCQYAKVFRYKESKGEIIVHIYANSLKKMYIALPPVYEQDAIANFLDYQIENIDNAIKSHNHQITLLQERKQIIINEVVTGKVKV